ncbi:MAG: hypothetical protein ABI369_15760 [Acetobacteraceae bacterium]
MKVALDANLPASLAHALDALLRPDGGSAISIADRFGPGAKDVDWIGALDKEGGWILVTVDRKLRTRPHERAALGQARMATFVLAAGWNQEPFWNKAAGLIRWWPRIAETAAEAPVPALFEVPHGWRSGRLRRL